MSIYDTLNPSQKEAVEHTKGPLLILAGAGSGKTRVLTHRVAFLIDKCSVSPWNILALTFTNKAASEMRSRVDDIVGYGSENIWVSTFHSTCVRILRRYIDKLGYDNSFTIYDSDDQKTLIRSICKKLNIDTKSFKETSFLSVISSAKDELISHEEYSMNSQTDFSKKYYAEVYREYQVALKGNNALDFDDLIVKTVELFRNHPDVLDYYQQRFQYIMVDEYQDTNTAQFKLISILAAKSRNLCVVGDDDQSIYKFRGANIYNILNFEKEYSNAKVIKLEQNYRSTQNILDAANEVIKNNKSRKVKSLWTDKEEGDLIEYNRYDSEYDEASCIVEDIAKAVSQGCDYNNFAILYRTNAQSRVFEEKFILKNIPYRIIGGVNFYQRKEVKDLLSYLKVIDNKQDDLAVKRIINVPKRGIGLTTIQRVESYAEMNNLSFYEAISEVDKIPSLGKASIKISSFVNMIKLLKTKLSQGLINLHDLILHIIEETAYVKELETSNTEDAESRIENINELISKIVTYQNTAEEPSLGELLEEIALIADVDNLRETNNAVILMTIHSAKGLEFPYVYLSGMEEGVFPGYMTINYGDEADMEEERRLCYVGITRAREKLSLSSAAKRMVRGEIKMNSVSRFVEEIPDHLLQTKVPVAKRISLNNTNPTDTARKNFFETKPSYQTQSFAGAMNVPLNYSIGDTVKHIKFGVGLVTDIVQGGKDYEVTVSFHNIGIKKMFASFAKLKKLE